MKLEGIDKEWQFVGNQHQVRFSNLPTGDYTLKIKASNDGVNWDEKGTERVDYPCTTSVVAFYMGLSDLRMYGSLHHLFGI